MRRIAIVQLGIGQVGRALARMVMADRQRLEDHLSVQLVYVAVADSEGIIEHPVGLSDAAWEAIFQIKSAGGTLAEIPMGKGLVSGASSPGTAGDAASAVLTAPWDQILGRASECVDDSLLLDLTAAPNTDYLLGAALRQEWGAVLANKIPLTMSQSRYDSLIAKGGERLRYEATVGAGLPVLATLRGLLQSGDRVRRIEGCLSGTLGYIAYQLQMGQTFSEAVRAAKQLGYTEPDPRQDLGGIDVARKALILTRGIGETLELDEIEVEPLTPPDMDDLPLPDFMARLESLDDLYAERVSKARARNNVLRYVAEIGGGGCRVGWQEVAAEGQMGALHGPDNLISFYTERYGERPLSIVGPGAGPEVTAAGVLSDILDLATQLR